MKCWSAFLLLSLCLCLPGCREPAPQPQPPRIGAVYHFWKVEDFQRGYLRARLDPPQYPEAGHYNSYDPVTIERHIRTASRHGIDFFALMGSQQWEGSELRLEAYLSASNVEDMAFCWISSGVTGEAFENELVQLSRRAFGQPSYLHLGERPVVILKGSYAWDSEQLEIFDRTRRRLEGAGFNVFWVAEELNWDSGEVPDLSRSRSDRFDAQTGIRVQWKSRAFRWRGYAASSALMSDLAETAKRARREKVPYVPTIFPGYNGNGPDGAQPGYVIAREWRVQDGGSGLFREMVQFGLKAVDPRAPLLLINSWNGWSDDTAVEPVEPAAPTYQDSGRFRYTHFFSYEGYGNRLLEGLEGSIVAVRGRALTHSGYPAAGMTVSAWSDQRFLVSARCDSEGYFSLPRSPEGVEEYQVGLDRGQTRSVPLSAEATATANLFLSGQPAAGVESLFPPLSEEAVRELESFSPREHDLVRVGTDELRADFPWIKWPEPLRARLAELVQPGECVLDLGAGAGLQSVALARLLGPQSHFYAFEPEPKKFGLLYHNWKSLGLEELTPHQQGLEALQAPDFPSLSLIVVGKVPLLNRLETLLARERPWLLVQLESARPGEPSVLLGKLFRRGFRTFFYERGYRLARAIRDDGTEAMVDGAPGPVDPRVEFEGFGNGEAESEISYRWSNKGEVIVRFTLVEVEPGEPYTLGLSARCFAPLSPLKTEMVLNDVPAGSLELTESWCGYELPLPKDAVVAGSNELLFRFERTGRPSDFDPQTSDGRPLGMALDLLWVAQSGSKR